MGTRFSPRSGKSDYQQNSKKVKAVSIFGLVAIFLVALVFFILPFSRRVLLSPSKDGQAPYQGPTDKVILGNFTGVYSLLNIIAQENGYFKSNGLEVEVHEYDSAPKEIEDLLAGKIHIAIASDFTGVRNIFTNKKLRVITQISKQDVFQMLARKDKGIRSISDLKGKKIGVTSKSVGEFFLGEFLTFNNIPLSEVNLVDLPITDVVTQLESGEIDAAVLYDPFSYNLQKKLGDKALIWQIQDDQKVYALSYSTDPYIKSHPDVIRRYLHAMRQSEEYIKEHDTATTELVARKFDYKNEYVQYIWPKIRFNLSLEQGLLLTMEDQARFAIENKLTTETTVPNYIDFIYFDGLTNVKPDSVTIVH